VTAENTAVTVPVGPSAKKKVNLFNRRLAITHLVLGLRDVHAFVWAHGQRGAAHNGYVRTAQSRRTATAR
jgi:hypothetical protein